MELSEALTRLEEAVDRLTQLAALRSAPKALTLDEAAAQLSVSPRTLARMAKKGEIRTVTLGRRVLVPTSELSRVLEPSEPAPRPRRTPRGAPPGEDEATTLRAALRRR